MKISKSQARRQDWDEVKSWNYKLSSLSQQMSIVYAELEGVHGEVKTNKVERVYYILDGEGEFSIDGKTVSVSKEDVITVPPNTIYDYKQSGDKLLKVLLFMELWDN